MEKEITFEDLTPYERWQSQRFGVRNIIPEVPAEDQTERIIPAAVIDFENELLNQ